MANIHQSTDQDQKNLKDPEKFEIKYYNDHSPSSEIPPFLTEANFYFTKNGLHDLVSNQQCEMVSESELPTTQSNEVMERKMRLQTARQITNLIVSLTTLSKVQKQIDVTNNTLVALQMQMIENTEATVRFISEVN